MQMNIYSLFQKYWMSQMTQVAFSFEVNLVVTVSGDGLAPTNAWPSAGIVLTTKLRMSSSEVL